MNVFKKEHMMPVLFRVPTTAAYNIFHYVFVEQVHLRFEPVFEEYVRIDLHQLGPMANWALDPRLDRGRPIVPWLVVPRSTAP